MLSLIFRLKILVLIYKNNYTYTCRYSYWFLANFKNINIFIFFHLSRELLYTVIYYLYVVYLRLIVNYPPFNIIISFYWIFYCLCKAIHTICIVTKTIITIVITINTTNYILFLFRSIWSSKKYYPINSF